MFDAADDEELAPKKKAQQKLFEKYRRSEGDPDSLDLEEED